MNTLTHFDEAGQAHMVDIAAKPATLRLACAEARVVMQISTANLIKEGKAGKGDVLGVARLAGIMAAKRTSELIPLCHGLNLAHMSVDFAWGDEFTLIDDNNDSAERAELIISATCGLIGSTGVEMEAMTAVSIAALTIYDMCKAVDRFMVIDNIHLTHKSGGKSGVIQG